MTELFVKHWHKITIIVTVICSAMVAIFGSGLGGWLLFFAFIMYINETSGDSETESDQRGPTDIGYACECSCGCSCQPLEPCQCDCYDEVEKTQGSGLGEIISLEEGKARLDAYVEEHLSVTQRREEIRARVDDYLQKAGILPPK